MSNKMRSINTHFWQDNWVIDLDPTEKLLFLYLLTNPHTNMLGVYEIHIRKICFDTGIDKDMVGKIFDRFEQAGKATYKQGFVILHKFLKHQHFNENMRKSACNDFLQLPEWLQRDPDLQPIIEHLEPLPKDYEPLIKGKKPFPKDSEPFAEIEREGERELEREKEKEQTPARPRTREGNDPTVSERALNNYDLPEALAQTEGFDQAYRKYLNMRFDVHKKPPNAYQLESEVSTFEEWRKKGVDVVEQIQLNYHYQTKNLRYINDNPKKPATDRQRRRSSGNSGDERSNQYDSNELYQAEDLP